MLDAAAKRSCADDLIQSLIDCRGRIGAVKSV